MNIVIFGPPGSGKGTQAKLLAERYGIPQVSTGDIFRAAMKAKSELGLKIINMMNSGHYVSDDITIGVVKKRLEDVDCAEGFILDGFPRTLAQAEALDEFSHVDFVIVLDVPYEEIIKRTSKRKVCSKCNRITTSEEGQNCKECRGKLISRSDEDIKIVKTRLMIYQDTAQPVINYYRSKGVLHTIAGNRSVEDVFNDILSVLGDVE